MNEKIEKLKQEAQIKVYSHGAFGEDETYYRLDADKFAELIILECANFVADQDENNFPSPVTISRRIKNHFGIE